MLSAPEIGRVVAKLAAALRPDRIILFGPYAKRTATGRSDLDFLVVKQTALPMARRADAAQAMLAGSLIRIDIHVYTPEEVEAYAAQPYSFLNSVLKTGIVVYERDVALQAKQRP